MSGNEKQSEDLAAESNLPESVPETSSPEHEEFHHWINSKGKVHLLPHWLGRRLHVPEDVELIDTRLASNFPDYLVHSV